MSLELKKAIEQISKDRGLDRDMLISTLEEAVRTSVTRKYGDDLDVEVHYSDDTGDIEVFQFKFVVDEVEDPLTQISLEDARQHDPSIQIDDEMGFRLKVEDLGRIAAQSAKQVIIQRMRDAEQELIYEEFKDRVGEIVSGMVQRRDKGGWVINLGRTEALLPREEQIPSATTAFRRSSSTCAAKVAGRRSSFPVRIVTTWPRCSVVKCRKWTTAACRSWVWPGIPVPAPRWPCFPVSVTSMPWAPVWACAVPEFRT